MAGTEEPALVEHAGKGPDGERSPAEPEEVHPVAGLVALHEAAVGVLDVLLEAVSGHLVALGAKASLLLVLVPAARTDAGVVPGDRVLGPSRRARTSRARSFCCARTRCRSRRSR